MNDATSRSAILARHRKASWPYAPACYRDDPNTRTKWMAGVYDAAAPIIRAFADFEATLPKDPPWHSPLGGLLEARRVLQEAQRALVEDRDRNTHIKGVYEPAIAALQPALAELAVLTDPARTAD